MELEVKALGNVRMTEYGIIPFDTFLELFRIIRKYSKLKIDPKI